ncbi:hypothetical protein SPI_00178 [Niveomyces insectorum RCEF 264]|uniref:Rhodopsin domain-containing protein n=1 Tax=Niveomyces insectorum RCEF 264 TaxID=1081102 RepID=A0A167ZWK9_9HYPO|nr:hypothetical protein SPI_00178 [Niveomyces insectorum RCEF 264]
MGSLAGHLDPAAMIAKRVFGAALNAVDVAVLAARDAAAAPPDAGPPPPPYTGPLYPTSGLQKFGFAIIFFFPALALVVVGLRTYSRVTTKQFGIDDALIILAMALSIGETSATYMFMKTNFIGIHIADVPPTWDTVYAGIWNFAVQVLYNPILALVKTSMLLFLLKLGGHKPGIRWSIHVLNALNLSLMVAIFLVVIFQCKPIAYNWDVTIPGGKCIQQGVFYLATAALTIFTDVLNLALPFWVFLDLKMPVRIKVALLFVFLLGAIVTVVGVVRLDFIYKGFFGAPAADPTYTLGFCTSAIETNLAIICASAPSLRGLVRSWFPNFLSINYPNYDPRYPSNSNARAGYGGQRSNPYGNGSTHTAVNSSPSASEEEIMTYNGIMRTTNVKVLYDNESERKDSVSRERSRDRRSSMGMRTSVSGSL